MSASPEQSPVPASADELWEKTLALLREDGKSYALTWLDRMQALEVKDGNLVLGVPDRFFRDWVDDHYRPLLEDAISRIHGGSMGIGYEVVGTSRTDASLSATSSGRTVAAAPRPAHDPIARRGCVRHPPVAIETVQPREFARRPRG